MVREKSEVEPDDVSAKPLARPNGGKELLFNLGVPLLSGSEGTGAVCDWTLDSVVKLKQDGAEAIAAGVRADCCWQ